MLIKQIYQKNVTFVTIGILKILVLNMNLIFVMDVIMRFNNIATVCVGGGAYRTQFWYMSKDGAVKIMTGSNLVDKNGILENFFYYI